MGLLYKHLTELQRVQLDVLLKKKERVRAIAFELKVNPSTIYRETKRNSGLKGYRQKQAQDRAEKRASSSRKRPSKITPRVHNWVHKKLDLQWSPVQISGWLKLHKKINISHETIYKYIWLDKSLGGQLYRHLRHKGKKYNKRGSSRSGRGCIPNRIDISNRPKIVEEKSRLGDWELDTIIGKKHQGAVVSMVDRASKLTRLFVIPDKSAKQTSLALQAKLGPMKKNVLTLTSDNGKEFSYHQEVSRSLKAEFYFATPYHSWERGLNEHTNGLVRQYLPKSMSFENLSQKELDKIESLLNNRPRKVLGFKTPKEVFRRLKSVALRG